MQTPTRFQECVNVIAAKKERQRDRRGTIDTVVGSGRNGNYSRVCGCIEDVRLIKFNRIYFQISVLRVCMIE